MEEQKEKSRLSGRMPICAAHSGISQPSLRSRQKKARTASQSASGVLRKLREQRGETLTETMAAMVIVALGGILLVSLVTAAGRVISRADTAYDAYISARNEVETAQSQVMFDEGHWYMSSSFLASAIGAECVWEEDEQVLILRVTDAQLAGSVD